MIHPSASLTPNCDFPFIVNKSQKYSVDPRVRWRWRLAMGISTRRKFSFRGGGDFNDDDGGVSPALNIRWDYLMVS